MSDDDYVQQHAEALCDELERLRAQVKQLQEIQDDLRRENRGMYWDCRVMARELRETWASTNIRAICGKYLGDDE